MLYSNHQSNLDPIVIGCISPPPSSEEWFCCLGQESSDQAIGIEGAHDAWPRGAKYPRPGQIQVVVGQPIDNAEIVGLSEEEISKLLFERIPECLLEARRHYHHVG